MKLFKTGLLGAGLAAGALALTAGSAYGVTITPYNTQVTGDSPSTSFTVNSSGASVSCSENTATGTIGEGPGNDTVPLDEVVFDDCVTSFNTGADVTANGDWEIVATDSGGNGYISIGGATVDTGICSISVGAQDVDGWVDDVADELHVYDTSVSYTASPALTCILIGVGTGGNATFDATTAPYALDVDISVS